MWRIFAAFQKEKTIFPAENWFSYGQTYDGEHKDGQNRYIINVGPKIVDPNYPDDGKLQRDDFGDYPYINIVVENIDTGNVETIPCVISNIKAHTYNTYPTSEHPKDNGHTAFFEIENGWGQTGIAYPLSDNANQGIPFAIDNIDGSMIEFVGTTFTYKGYSAGKYRLKEIQIIENE